MMLEISVLTLNIWGIPYVSSDRMKRIEAISTELCTGNYDIVSLQEVWSQFDTEHLRKNTAGVLPYSHYFFSGVLGAGLLVLSKYPIVSCLFHAWCVNGYFHRIQHADWFGGKGVGMCKILIGEHIIHFYNSHLHAEYDNENDDYQTHRVIQAFDAAQFIEATRGNSVLQILAGDLNTKPNDISYKVLLYTSKMRDCCKADSLATNVSPQNSYTKKHELIKNPHGIRIDHIFVRSANHFDVTVVECKLPFPDRVPGQKFSYSDHEAVLAKLKLSVRKKDDVPIDFHCLAIKSQNIEELQNTNNDHRNDNSNTEKNCNEIPTHIMPISERITVLYESVTLCDQQLQQLAKNRIIYYTSALILFLLLVALQEFTVPFGLKTLYLLFKLIVVTVMIFFVFMASIWNYMEHNAILAAKTSMEIMLRGVERNDLGFIY